MALLHMAHVGQLPPIWDLLDHQSAAETFHLLSLVAFTDLLNGCSPDATARYLHLALMSDYETIGEAIEKKVYLRGQAPAADASAKQVAILTDQLATMPSKHQEAQTAAAFNAERAKLAEWDGGQLRGQIGPATTLRQP
jgi:hypothetical protein